MAGIGPNNRSVFDDLEFSDKEISPFWAISDISDEKEVEKWIDNAVSACQSYYRDYFQIQMDNLLLFRGIQWLSADRASNRILDRQGFPNIRNPRIVINHLADFVTQWVSRLTRYRPAVAIYPARSEQLDADDAKIAKSVLDYIWYQARIDETLQDFVRQMKIFGEAYMWITWNPQKGDVHPDWLAAQQQGQKVPVLDSQGIPVMNTKGEPMFMDHAPHVGEVDYQIDAPWHVFDQPCRNRRNIDWSFRWYLEDVEYLKAKYPDRADEITVDADINNLYTAYRLDVGRLKNQVVVYEFYHRSHEFMEKGRYIKRVKNVILENTDLPYEHGQIPYIYMADQEIPDQIRGQSFFQQLFPIQHQINATASLIYKSLVLYAHPKLVIQDGSCDMQQLLNESTVVQYSGGVAPQLLTQSPVAPELFNHMRILEETANKLSGVFTMSRGEAPSGIRAAKALRVLEEQEDKRAYVTAVKYNNIGLVENAKMTLSVAGTFYDDADGRLAQIVGRDNEFKILQFKTANLSKPYHVRVENTTALSLSPAARIDEITELSQMQFTPQSLMQREQVIQLLDMTASDQFKDIVTRAIRCAQSENDDFLAGRFVSAPVETEDFIAHWKIHLQMFQSREWKELVSPERKQAAQQHLLITEYAMHKKAYGIIGPATGVPIAVGNPIFAQRLMTECPDFPMLLGAPLPTPAPMGMAPQGGAPGAPMGPSQAFNGFLQEAGPVDNQMPLEGGEMAGPPVLPPMPEVSPT
jgi:hypothetical protein